ncbi:MAG: PKD domain-containing protein [Bacteroidota bacterium]
MNRMLRLTFLGFWFVTVCPHLLGAGGFVMNQGQWPSAVSFRYLQGNSQLYLEAQGWTYALYQFPPHASCLHHGCSHQGSEHNANMKGHAFRVNFLGVNPAPSVVGIRKKHLYHNYFQGQDRKKWVTKVPVFEGVLYDEMYPGIDLKVYQAGGNLKYDWVIAPGNNPDVIRWEYEGLDEVISLKDGGLELVTSVGKLIEMKPYAYQLINGNKVEVPSQFQVNEDGNLGFEFPEGYDTNSPLVIDPLVIFSTYSGATRDNWGFTATYDYDGNAYGGGVVFNPSYPVTTGAFQTNFGQGPTDIVISKYTPDGSQQLFATYLGGDSLERPHSLIVSPNDELIVFGYTESANFPVSANAFDPTYNGFGDIYVTKFSPDGARLIGSTFLGGTNVDGELNNLRENYGDDARGDVQVDDEGSIYLATVTSSQDFPIATLPVQSFQGKQDACIAKFNKDLSQLLWSSYFGGPEDDAAYSIALAGRDILYVTGGTASPNFPIANGVMGTPFQGDVDAFVARIDLAASRIRSSTLFGTPDYEQSYFVEVDDNEDVYLFGQTYGNFPIAGGVYGVPNGHQFIMKLNSDFRTLYWSTLVGSGGHTGPDISPTAFLVDECGRIYISGWGNLQRNQSQFLPLTPDALQDSTDGSYFYLAAYERDMDSLVFATYFGDNSGLGSGEHVDGGTSRFDPRGVVYQAVCASCNGLSGYFTTPTAYSRTNQSGGGCNMLLFKIDFQLPSVKAQFIPQDSLGDLLELGCAPLTVNFNNFSTGTPNTRYLWDFGDGDTLRQREPVHTFTRGGVYEVTLVLEDTTSCNFSDTLTATITVYDPAETAAGGDTTICQGDTVLLAASASGPDIFWDPAPGLDELDSVQTLAYPTSSITYYLNAENPAGCNSRDSIRVSVSQNVSLQVDLPKDTTICRGEEVAANASGAQTFTWLATPVTSLDADNPSISFAPEDTTVLLLIGNKDSLCTDTLTRRINVIPAFTASIQGPTRSCAGDPLVFRAVTDAPIFSWNTGETSPFLRIRPTEDQTIELLIPNPAPCPDTRVQQFVDVFQPPNLNITGGGPVCEGQSVELSVNTSAQVLWSTGEQSRTISVRPSETTTYSVTGTNGPCEVGPEFFTVEIVKNPIAAFSLSRTPFYAPVRIQFENTSQFAQTYEWNFGDGSPSVRDVNPYRGYSDSGTYTVTLVATNFLGCSDRTSYTFFVDLQHYLMPTAFSPNGDGANDFLLMPSYGLQSIDLSIFNRWGRRIFFTDNPNFSWDGTFQGRAVPEGVYVYRLKALGRNGLEKSEEGTITIIR